MTATTHVILVDPEDRPIGTLEKIAAHRLGLRHRAFSIFIFRERDEWELLLQQRAAGKYHSPGLWTNTCCSHPKPAEGSIREAAEIRLQEEMGISAPLSAAGWFHYVAPVGNNLTENEIDHVLIGIIGENQTVTPNAMEAESYRWITLKNLTAEQALHPEQFTPWFGQALALALKNLPG